MKPLTTTHTTNAQDMDNDSTRRREIRVFISSTFADMHRERNHLVKKVFPAFAAECRRRNVEFTPLDLRWGITEEESRSGRVVEICMDEITRTRPFFIGLIGGRYGWVPDRADAAGFDKLSERYPWISDYFNKGMSITEMEMQYGVLDSQADIHAHFFIRRDSSIPRKFREKDAAVEEKRRRLKGKIREAATRGRCTATDYGSVASLGKAVHARMMEMLDRLYPADRRLSAYDLFEVEQSAILSSLRRVYQPVGIASPLAGHNNDRKLIVTGDPGSGLSAFAANELVPIGFAAANGKPARVIHTFVTDQVATVENLRRMFIHTLMKAHPQVEVPEMSQTTDNEVPFSEILSRFPQEEYVWIIDGPEKMSDITERNLAGVLKYADLLKLLVIVVPRGETCDLVKGALGSNTGMVIIPDISPSRRRDITRLYLDRYGKRLNERQISAITSGGAIGSVKMLTTFLSILVNFGVFEDVDSFIHRFVTVADADEFYDRILDYLEDEFGQEKTAIFFMRLRASGCGLSEDTLMNGVARTTLDRAAMLGAMAPFVMTRAGQVMLADSQMREAVDRRYRPEGAMSRRLSRLVISDCLKGRRLIRKAGRKEEMSVRILGRLLRGFPSLTDEALTKRWEVISAELLLQRIKLDQYDKVRKSLAHFACSAMGGDKNTMLLAASYLKDKGCKPASMFDGLDLILSHYLLERDYAMPMFWKQVLVSTPEDEKAFRKGIMAKWCPRKIRLNLLGTLGMGEQELTIDQMIENLDPARFSLQGVMQIVNEVPFVMSWLNDGSVRRVGGLLRSKWEKFPPQGETSALLAVASAFVSLRLGDREGMDKWLGVVKASSMAAPLDHHITFLQELAAIVATHAKAAAHARNYQEYLGKLTVGYQDLGDNLLSSVMKLILAKEEGRLQQEVEKLGGEMTGNPLTGYFLKSGEVLYNLKRYSEAEGVMEYVASLDLPPADRGYILWLWSQTLLRLTNFKAAAEVSALALKNAVDNNLVSGYGDCWHQLITQWDISRLSGDITQNILNARNLLDYALKRGDDDYILTGYNRLNVSCTSRLDRLRMQGEKGSEEYRQLLGESLAAARYCFNALPGSQSYWMNLVDAMRRYETVSPVEDEMWEAALETAERLLADPQSAQNKSVIQNAGRVFHRMGLTDRFNTLMMNHPDIIFFDRKTQNLVVLLTQIFPNDSHSRMYLQGGIDVVRLWVEKARKDYPVDEFTGMLADLLECAPASAFHDLFYTTPDYGMSAHSFISDLVVMALACVSGERELARKIDKELAAYLLGGNSDDRCYWYYLLVKGICDGKPLQFPGDMVNARNICLDLLYAEAGISKESRGLFQLANLAVKDESAASRIVTASIEAEGMAGATLTSVLKSFASGLDYCGHANIWAFDAFCESLDRHCVDGRWLADNSGHLLTALYKALRCHEDYKPAPKVDTWRAWMSLLRKARVEIPSPLVDCGLGLLRGEEMRRLFDDWHRREHIEDKVSSPVTYLAYMRRLDPIADHEEIGALIEEATARTDDDSYYHLELMAEKTRWLRYGGSHAQALGMVDRLDEKAQDWGDRYFDYIDPMFPVEEILLDGRLDDFERRCDLLLSPENADLMLHTDLQLLRCVYLLKSDNAVSERHLYASLDENVIEEGVRLEDTRQEALVAMDVTQGEDEEACDDGEASPHRNLRLVAYAAWRFHELAAYHRRHGASPDVVNPLVATARRLAGMVSDCYPDICSMIVADE